MPPLFSNTCSKSTTLSEPQFFEPTAQLYLYVTIFHPPQVKSASQRYSISANFIEFCLPIISRKKEGSPGDSRYALFSSFNGSGDWVTRLREQIEGRSTGAVGAVDEVVVADHFSEGVGGGADAGGQEYEVALRCDDPGLRGEIGVGAEDAEVGEGRRLGGEEGDLDAVPLARGGGSGGLVRAVGDVAPNAEKDTVGVGGADVGQGRWVEGLLLGQGDHGGCCGGEPQEVGEDATAADWRADALRGGGLGFTLSPV